LTEKDSIDRLIDSEQTIELTAGLKLEAKEIVDFHHSCENIVLWPNKRVEFQTPTLKRKMPSIKSSVRRNEA
jgi:hypothetical protein